MENNNLWIILCVILLVGVIVYFCAGKKSGFSKGTVDNKDKDIETDVKIENFVAAGGLDTSGAFLGNQYNLVQSPDAEVAATDYANLVAEPAGGFQNLVSEGSDLNLRTDKQPHRNGVGMRAMERLSGLQGQALMPRTSESITPFAVALGNPKSFKYSVNQSRIQLKPKLWEASLYAAIRGSIPIKYNRNVPMISVSQYGRDNQRFDGLCSAGSQALYNKYTGGEFKSLPVLTAGAGQAGGYGGGSSEIIMDNYT